MKGRVLVACVGNFFLGDDGFGVEVARRLAGMLGAEAGQVLVVGCEPASVAEGIGLSEPVAAAVDEAVRVVLGLVRDTGGKPANSSGVAAKE